MRSAKLGIAAPVLLAAIGIVYVGLALTPSHIAVALSQLGFTETGLLAGTARPIRYDDYWIFTPLIRAVVENGFGPVDRTSPYGEAFRSLFGAPVFDWSLAFKPQFWGFLVLDPAQALSFYFFFFYAAFAVGYTVLLRRLRVPTGLAILVALTLLSSQLPQVWWTQRAPVYAFAPWPLLAFLSRAPWWTRLPALVYATVTWLVGEFYPPAIIGNAFAWAVVVIAFFPGELAPERWRRRLLPALAAVALAVGIVVLYLGDLVPALSDTIYPGHRQSEGGGVPLLVLLAHLVPGAATFRYEPVVVGLNACEVGVLGTFLPLMVLCFADGASLRALVSRHRFAAAAWGFGLALMLAWLVLPLPSGAGAPFLWNRVPPLRLLWGFGLLLNLGAAVVAARVDWRMDARRAGLFAAVVLAIWLLSRVVLFDPDSLAAALPAARSWRAKAGDLWVLAPVALIALGHALRPAWAGPKLRPALLAVALAANGLAFGGFNPIQSARAVFTDRTTPFLEAARRLGGANPHGWAAIPGYYGSDLNAFGVRAINHVLARPDLPFFRALYPDLPEAAFQDAFNRFGHVQVGFGAQPFSPQGDVVLLPVFDVGTPLPVSVVEHPAEAPPGGRVEALEPEPLDDTTWRVVVRGWAPFRGIVPGQRLEVGGAGLIIRSARAVRLVATEAGTALADHAYDTGGFALELRVTVEAGAPLPAGALAIVAFDETGAAHRPMGP